MNRYCKGCKKIYNMILEQCPFCKRFGDDYRHTISEIDVQLNKMSNVR